MVRNSTHLNHSSILSKLPDWSTARTIILPHKMAQHALLICRSFCTKTHHFWGKWVCKKLRAPNNSECKIFLIQTYQSFCSVVRKYLRLCYLFEFHEICLAGQHSLVNSTVFFISFTGCHFPKIPDESFNNLVVSRSHRNITYSSYCCKVMSMN